MNTMTQTDASGTCNGLYNSAPLPFQGQKRQFLREFRKAVLQFDQATTFIDLFGGSGLLSQNIKCIRPDVRVIYNDYDDYSTRIANIPRTNGVLRDIRMIVDGCPTGRNKPFSPTVKETILDAIRKHEKTGYVDYITLSASLLFSGKRATGYEELSKENFYNGLKHDDYPQPTGYLDGVEILRDDYRTIYEQYKNVPGVVFVLDPPYLSTDVGSYRNYWKLSDYLDVLVILRDSNYIYFTSEKSNIIELCAWIEANPYIGNPFAGAVRKERQVAVNYNSGYKDMMFYK